MYWFSRREAPNETIKSKDNISTTMRSSVSKISSPKWFALIGCKIPRNTDSCHLAETVTCLSKVQWERRSSRSIEGGSASLKCVCVAVCMCVAVRRLTRDTARNPRTVECLYQVPLTSRYLAVWQTDSSDWETSGAMSLTCLGSFQSRKRTSLVTMVKRWIDSL